MNEQTFHTSRFSKGNAIFRSRISLTSQGVTLKVPSLFSGDEKTVPYSRISSVNIRCPFIGYSDIVIETTGEGGIAVHGFTASDARNLKELILEKVNSTTPE